MDKLAVITTHQFMTITNESKKKKKIETTTMNVV